MEIKKAYVLISERNQQYITDELNKILGTALEVDLTHTVYILSNKSIYSSFFAPVIGYIECNEMRKTEEEAIELFLGYVRETEHPKLLGEIKEGN